MVLRDSHTLFYVCFLMLPIAQSELSSSRFF